MKRLLSAILFAAATVASAQEKTVIVAAPETQPAAGAQLRVPPDAKISAQLDRITFNSTNQPNPHETHYSLERYTVPHTVVKTSNLALHIWAVPYANNVDDATAHTAELIQGEFTNFTATLTNQLTIAGARALQLHGPGHEADDGDPGNAEVVYFKVNGRVFAACTHGEFDDAARQVKPMLAILQTAAAPNP